MCKSSGTGSFPSFDHTLGDPLPGDIQITPAHNVIIVEGNYLLLQSPTCNITDTPLYWHSLASHGIFDINFYLSYDNEQFIINRLIHRHMYAWSISQEAAYARVLTNDLLNSRFIHGDGNGKELSDYIINIENGNIHNNNNNNKFLM